MVITFFLSTAAYTYSGGGSLSEAIEAVLVDTAYSTPPGVVWCRTALLAGLSTVSNWLSGIVPVTKLPVGLLNKATNY